MPNETQIECYFKSADLAKLCKGSTDIIINFKATYPPGALPKYEISAKVFTKGAKAGKTAKAALMASSSEIPPPTDGCPSPCH